ncbi:hypothetical protein G6F46_011436 [Rhizopus delemar]|nr:hypothetical protein G6F43_007631 [Rhizopus delemar]KAG1537786.1 hypothetical protein G6F51_010159 [Rhizopus arrhizus]KAG1457788.1 hypothetical protein G6F55_005721 [Rhizopus delemar]KAG1489774.1 hypothetical protein G6F54_011196 [Rhizopus delemar]KAG1510100.1 hypothetical protein G6F52_010983 [Rhizopus delemar]
MDDAIEEYTEALEALEKQRESLELVMLKMGEEWEESGAGIGWMREENGLCQKSLSPSNSETTSKPSHDYLQSLLNVNDELLAQSLASLPNNTQENNYQYSILPSSMISPPLSEGTCTPFVHHSISFPATPSEDEGQEKK